METVASHSNTAAPQLAKRKDWIGLAVIALACVLYSMDLTVLNLAVPHLSAALKPTGVQLLWIMDIYGFLVAGFLITMGTLGDRIGRRKLLLMGAAAFGIASIIAAFAPTAELLIAARALLGVAGATIAPSTLSLIRNMFHDDRQRTFAIGIWIAGYSAGGAIGPVVGGLMLEYFWWGSVFLVGVPVMLLLIVLGRILLPEFRDPNAGRLDLISAGLSLFSVLAVIFGLKKIAEGGLDTLPLLSIVAGLILGAAFIYRQRKLADPMIDLKLFRVKLFSSALLIYSLGIFFTFGSFFFTFQYLQLVVGLSPMQAGLWSLPSFVAFIIGSMIGPALVKYARPAFVIGAGLVVAAIGFVVLSQADAEMGLYTLVVATFINSLGLAPVFTITTDIVVGSAPPERAGMASAISETGAEFGGATGIAVLGSIGTAIYRNRVSAGMPDGIPAEAAATARDTLGGAVAEAQNLPGELGAVLLNTAKNAFVDGLHFASVAAAIALAILAILAFSLRKPPAVT